MQQVNGRTPEQWAAYDRVKLIGATLLSVLLLVLWLAGLGPTRAAGCCGLLSTATVVPPVTVAPATPPSANLPSTMPPEAPPEAPRENDPACASALNAEVLFATNSAELTPDGRSLLDRLAPCWRGGRFEVQGHTDASGGDAVNQPLSERRAAAVVDHLVARGTPASVLTARGYGSSRPVADDTTPGGRARNRRVEFRRDMPSPDK